jgi:hypothetical protein
MPRQDQSGLLKLHHRILILILILIQPGEFVSRKNEGRLLKLHPLILILIHLGRPLSVPSTRFKPQASVGHF